ncbi:uncharacterized protein LOC129372711 [Poeciliopsis prolifica]|uniref:uncharacterized protein LOC129372711 n=1 Tax=Poeciliopsis prolifica TaxID=188132 RepID=UPI002413B90E|nr:uncharacterized protein LOC129372711 [Poeciliopsis prolifica]
MKLLFFLIVTLTSFTERSLHAWPDSTGASGVNLNGKMFTLSGYYGRLTFYSPYEMPPGASSTSYQTTGYTDSASTGYTSTPSYTQTNTGTAEMSTHKLKTTTLKPTTHHHRYTTRSSTRYPWSTAPSIRGVSVCLRYITDSQGGSIFTLSPSRQSLRLEVGGLQSYALSFNSYNTVFLQPYLKLWPYLTPNMWTSICLTVDSVKGVVQMFKNSNMSSRKLLNNQYVWSGDRVIDFSNFEGQITDVQVWDFPLRYQEVLYYMSSGGYGSYQGSVLSWSYISYSQSGRTLLEDGYQLQREKLNHKQKHRNYLKREFKPKKLFLFEERKREQWEKEM